MGATGPGRKKAGRGKKKGRGGRTTARGSAPIDGKVGGKKGLSLPGLDDLPASQGPSSSGLDLLGSWPLD